MQRAGLLTLAVVSARWRLRSPRGHKMTDHFLQAERRKRTALSDRNATSTSPSLRSALRRDTWTTFTIPWKVKLSAYVARERERTARVGRRRTSAYSLEVFQILIVLQLCVLSLELVLRWDQRKMSINQNNFDIVTDLLRNNVFVIPTFQRPYSWDEDAQLKDLFEDVKHASTKDIVDHYMSPLHVIKIWRVM